METTLGQENFFCTFHLFVKKSLKRKRPSITKELLFNFVYLFFLQLVLPPAFAAAPHGSRIITRKLLLWEKRER